ncbi:hypothetical protein [Sorangium sp. So ce341]|uniref:hypothetical protein n=1 Tax=Sorangium sp. So ce341 TaxID=3133302 RepID=UPI003F63C0BA
MRSFCTMGLLLTLSISSLLAGTGCISPELPAPDSDTVSAGVESADADHGSSCDGDKLPPPPPSGACWLGEMGDGFTCYDKTALKDQAHARCAGMNAALAGFDVDTLNPSCGGHEASKALFSCCAPGPLPPPPPPPETCWGGELGDGLTCVHGVELKDQAYITCRNQGADLAMFDYERDSPGCTGVTTARAFYECCPAAEPLPSPACWTSKIDHGDVCQPVQTLDEEATALCAETGQQLFHVGYGTGVLLCPEAWATSALFTCCP